MKPAADKAEKVNSRSIAIVAIASALTIFSLVSTKALLSQAAYQRRVVNAKHTAVNQLKTDITNFNNLVTSYKAFASINPNAMGGALTGTGPNDGDNAKLVLDALPPKYDFPALTTSLEKILKDDHVASPNISGADTGQSLDSSPTPTPVAMNFTVSGSGSYGVIQNLINDFQRSIRPFSVTSISLSGNQSNLNFTMSLNTYYQPTKTLNISQKAVK